MSRFADPKTYLPSVPLFTDRPAPTSFYPRFEWNKPGSINEVKVSYITPKTYADFSDREGACVEILGRTFTFFDVSNPAAVAKEVAESLIMQIVNELAPAVEYALREPYVQHLATMDVLRKEFHSRARPAPCPARD